MRSMASSPSAGAHANGDVHNHHGAAPRQAQRRGWVSGVWAWIDRKLFLYNVTTGLYMLDWWERYLLNAIVLLLLWLICYKACTTLGGTAAWHDFMNRGGL